MTSSSNVDWVALAAHLAGQATPTQQAWLDAWLAAHADHPMVLEELRTRWASVTPSAPSSTKNDSAWDELARAMVAGPVLPVVRTPARPAAPRFRYPGRIAAAGTAALLLGLGVVAWLRTGSAIPRETTPHTYAAAAGQLTTAKLPDGTQIILAPGSRVRYDATFGQARRDVYLDGKAYFDVSPDPARPFTVLTSNTSVQVLGTTFAVDGYDGDPSTQIIVRGGRVFVTETARLARSTPVGAPPPRQGALRSAPVDGLAEVLVAGDILDVGGDGAPVVRHRTPVSSALAWTNGVLTFTDVPATKVLRDIGRWYGVSLTLDAGDPAVGAKRVTATYDRVPLSLVLRELSSLIGAPVRHATHP